METSRLSLTSVSVQSLSGCNAIKTQGQFSFFFSFSVRGGSDCSSLFHQTTPPPSSPPPLASSSNGCRAPSSAQPRLDKTWLRVWQRTTQQQHRTRTAPQPRHFGYYQNIRGRFVGCCFFLSASLKGKLSFQFISYLFVFCDV